MTAYLVSVWLHILAAAAWIGSMIFFAAVIVPVLRNPALRTHATQIVHAVGKRYRIFGWISLALLLITGLANLHFRGIGGALLSDANFWSAGFGRLLAYKLGLVGVVLVVTLVHELLASRLHGSRRVASMLGRFTLLVSIVIAFVAVAMVRGC